jgi:hypothetical protein
VADNRRSQTRHEVTLSATLTIDGAPKNATVMNLSLGGALIAAASGRYAMGQHVNIQFAVPSAHEPIEVGATVRWSDDQGTGIQFDGLRARDVWALNKYFEQLVSSR